MRNYILLLQFLISLYFGISLLDFISAFVYNESNRESLLPDKSEFTELMKHKGRRKNMIEQIFKLTQGNEKTVEKVIIDENIHYMHMILNKGECLPEHFSNAKNVYITVVRGTLSATLNEQETHEYQAGTVLKVPFHTKMNLKNVSEETLEFIVVKAPAPNC